MNFRNAKYFFGECTATFFFVGKSPKAPGTMGSIAALPFAWFLWTLPNPLAWLVFAGVFAIGIWAAHTVIIKTGVPDHQSIVIDEVLGIFLTTSIASHIWWHYLLAFVLFRIFDIWKPWPVSWVDKNWKGAWGAIMDDIVAAMIATGILFVFLYFAGSRVVMEISQN